MIDFQTMQIGFPGRNVFCSIVCLYLSNIVKSQNFRSTLDVIKFVVRLEELARDSSEIKNITFSMLYPRSLLKVFMFYTSIFDTISF